MFRVRLAESNDLFILFEEVKVQVRGQRLVVQCATHQPRVGQDGALGAKGAGQRAVATRIRVRPYREVDTAANAALMSSHEKPPFGFGRVA